jgi:hypothetical protein
LSSPEEPGRLDAFHWAFDKLYPAIRFGHERIFRNPWFSQVTPRIWLGGAPTYGRDYDAMLADGITAVLDVRAERAANLAFYEAHDISYRRFRVPDIDIPNDVVLTEAVDWIDGQLAEGRTVLVHCAKGRGRSATIVAAYLMRADGLSFDEANQLLRSKRTLVKLEARHRRVLESWIATQVVARVHRE